MKERWQIPFTYLKVFVLIFVIGLGSNYFLREETLCVTETWCPDRGENAIVLALLFTIPFLVLLAFFLHIFPSVLRVIFDYPQHSFAGVFFLFALPPGLVLLIAPEILDPKQIPFTYAATIAGIFFTILTLKFASSIPADKRWKPKKESKRMGWLLVLGLLVCATLTVLGVSDW